MQRNIPNLRRHPDGSFWLPRSNRIYEDQLDMMMDRIPGRLIWYPKIYSMNFEELYSVLRGKEINIVGKGPSLDNLRSGHLNTHPTIGINEAVLTCEKYIAPEIVFGLTQDSNLKSVCKTRAAGLIINRRIASWYEGVQRLWIMPPVIFGEGLSAVMALRVAKFAGATKAHMWCFDACINGNVNYAKVVGYTPNLYGPPSRFLEHRGLIESSAEIPLEWHPTLI